MRKIEDICVIFVIIITMWYRFSQISLQEIIIVPFIVIMISFIAVHTPMTRLKYLALCHPNLCLYVIFFLLIDWKIGEIMGWLNYSKFRVADLICFFYWESFQWKFHKVIELCNYELTRNVFIQYITEVWLFY
jgi:hypothetical protein